MADPILDVQFSTEDFYSRNISAMGTTLEMISEESSDVTVLGSISPGAPLLSLFDDTVLDSAVSTVDISGIDQLQISVSGDKIFGRIY